MATERELCERIIALATENKNVTVDMARVNPKKSTHAELTAILADVKRQVAAVNDQDPVRSDDFVGRWVVSPGRSVSTQKKLYDAGEEIDPVDVGDANSFGDLISSGVVVRVEG